MSRWCPALCLALAGLGQALWCGPVSAGKAERVVVIAAEEAKAKGLFELGVSLDAGGLVATRFPGKDLYLVLSGPPAGPLGLEVRKGSLTKQSKPLPGALHPAGDAKIKVGRRRLRASAYTEGRGPARRHGCVVGLRPRRGKPALLLLRFWRVAGKTEHPGCAAIARRSPFDTILASVRLIPPARAARRR
jgi:hypothetical protein